MDVHALLKELPKDEYNQRRLKNVRPNNWQNPTPASRYNLVVVGGGSAGLVSAIIAASLGGKVALIERHLMGGDCLNVGCVPSKSIIRSAKIRGDMMNGQAYGIKADGSEVDFEKVMSRIRRVQADLSPADSVWRYRDEGVDIFLGEGRFTGPDKIEVVGTTDDNSDRQTLSFKKAIISTGSRPYSPAVPGLVQAGFLTNETVFNLTCQPKRLAVIGGGPIGCELAQAFRRLGSEVTLFHNASHILNREDADAAEIVQQTLLREEMKLVLESKITQVEQTQNGATGGGKVVHFTCPSGPGKLVVDEILVATGRVPNIEDLGLEVAGVETHPRRGILVNDYLQTANPNIYAAGDVSMAHKFTHAASAAAKIVVQNALFYGRKSLDDLIMPWCTYTDPEVAHVGLYEHEAEEQGIEVDTFMVHFDDNDRAVADGEEEGFIKVHVEKGSDKILGSTIVARTAGDMISQITLAMVAGVGLKTLADVIHPYPTQAEVIARVASAYTRTRLTPTVQKLFSGWMSVNRR